MEINKFAESAKGFTKSPLGIIALFIVLVYGFASLVVGLGNNLSDHIVPLIYFMVFFPILVFLGFLWLVAKHHNKLYGPSDFKDEDNFLKAQMMTIASLAAATAKNPGDNAALEDSQFKKIINAVSTSSMLATTAKSKHRILWVDDRPDNNIYERKAFEAQGIEFTLALSTQEALGLIAENNFDAIISDMGRKEGPREGYVLLDKLRAANNRTPFIIYAASNLPEHKEEAYIRGANGSTNRVAELFELVMAALTNTARS
ncbi:response regulator [Buttiauxella sp. 3AFRM03]|uniref:response regulator n=1 Tax=Buttiauxella TaxID=82976 RepID=UPI000EF763E3|nr:MULTISPECIES: response regulator [Buttiauxella]AYN26243.1 response regulator [Buttiauxella sp. 3AFRM03]MCE0824457.1 response regulator [Buttiauxella ferragutiae]